MIHHCVLLLFTLSGPAAASPQSDSLRRPESPVFKQYKARSPSPLIEQSDATYQLWQTFRLQQEANAGNAVSQFELSIRYLTGKGVKADTTKAVYWTRRAADQNHLLARFNLAIFAFNGWGTEWNPFEAFLNFRIAAQRNMPEARYALAQFYIENLVVPQNLSEAFRLTTLAADSGYAPAREGLKFFEQRGFTAATAAAQHETTHLRSASQQPTLQPLFLDFSPDTSHSTPDSILVDDLFKSTVFETLTDRGSLRIVKGKIDMDTTYASALRKVAEAGSPEALTLLGRCYEQGTFCTADTIAAALQYIRATRLDSRRASRLLLRLMAEEGFFKLLKARVGRNDPDAEYVWATLNALRLDHQLTDGQALQLLEHAASIDHGQALVELGLAHYAGRWVARDERKAKALWDRAALLGNWEARLRRLILRVRHEVDSLDAAVEELQLAARHGSVLAEIALAYCFEHGRGVPKNKGEAARLFRNSAQRGSQDAYQALVRMHNEIRPKDKEFVIPEYSAP